MPSDSASGFRRRAALLLLCGAALAALACGAGDDPYDCCPAAADDWPQWLGPKRSGVAEVTALPETWPEGGPPEVWRRALGPGFSTVSVRGDDLFVTYTEDGEEQLFRLDAATGEERWRRSMGPNFEEEYGDGPRGAPTVHGGVVMALSSRGRLVAAHVEDGALLWSTDIHRATGGGPLSRGYASSPLVDGPRVYLNSAAAGGPAAVALDRADGGVLWKAEKGRSAASSPILVEIGGRRHLVIAYAHGLAGLDPETGERLWRFEWKTKYGLNIATPVFLPPDRLLISAAYDQGSALVRVQGGDDGFTAQEVWTTRKFRNHFATSVVHGGHLYGFDNAILKSIDIATGEDAWRARGYGKGSLILADGKLIVLAEDGDLALVRANPEGHEELARTPVFDSKCWTAPTLAGGRLYLRNHEELVSLQLIPPAP